MQRLELMFDAMSESEVDVKPDIFFLILFGHLNVTSVRLEFVDLKLSEGVMIYSKCHIENVGYVIVTVNRKDQVLTEAISVGYDLQHPIETPVQLRID